MHVRLSLDPSEAKSFPEESDWNKRDVPLNILMGY